MQYTAVIQDYLKTIYTLQSATRPVTNGQLAQAFRVSAPAVTEMLKKLESQELVIYQAREGVTLTAAGEKSALELIRHHRLLELYLVQALGMSWDEVHAEAEVLEHVLSEALEERIAAMLGNPEFDPHGAPIPTRDGRWPVRHCRSLADVQLGTTALIVEVSDDDAARLRYFAQLGLIPNTPVLVQARAPFDGPLTLAVGDPAIERILDSRLAPAIRVCEC